MAKNIMMRLSQIQGSDKTFKKIREVLHPDTVITRCERCRKVIRPHIDEPYICGKCSE